MEELKKDALMMKVLGQDKDVRKEWLARIKSHLKSKIIVPGEFSGPINEAKKQADDDKGLFSLAYKTVDEKITGRPAGIPIVSEEEEGLYSSGKVELITGKWKNQLIRALQKYLPKDMAPEVTQAFRNSRSIIG